MLRLTASVIEVCPCTIAQWHRCTPAGARATNAAIGEALKAA
jgi:hypothetical protein